MTRNALRRAIQGTSAAFVATVLLLIAAVPTFAAPAVAAAVGTAGEIETPLALTNPKKPSVQKISRSKKTVKSAAVKAKKPKALASRPTKTAETSISAAVANANAQMPATDARGAAAFGDTFLSAPLEAAAAEQLSELGKSLNAVSTDASPLQVAELVGPEQQHVALPVSEMVPRTVTQARASASNDAWAQSSLIGKIFIAFGGMLTLASAARMLIA